MLTSTSIEELIKDYRPSIETQLGNTLGLFSLTALKETILAEALSYSVLDSGKRLRPILALITAEAIAKSSTQIDISANPALGLALAIELVHCGSLIHDDLPCMDDDDMRRGKPSNHKAFGEANALLAGDLLLCYPAQILYHLTRGQIDSDKLLEVQNSLSQAISDMIIGQALDLQLANGKDFSIEDLKQMQALKTGAIIKAAIKQAAILASASEFQVMTLERYAENIGLAFQITDDILDQTATSAELGKTAGKDIEQNKFTFVKAYGLQRAKQIANELISDAKKIIMDIDIYPDKLLVVADYVISRTN